MRNPFFPNWKLLILCKSDLLQRNWVKIWEFKTLKEKTMIPRVWSTYVNCSKINVWYMSCSNPVFKQTWTTLKRISRSCVSSLCFCDFVTFKIFKNSWKFVQSFLNYICAAQRRRLEPHWKNNPHHVSQVCVSETLWLFNFQEFLNKF